MAEPIEKTIQDFVVGVDNFGQKIIRFIIWIAVAVILFFMSYSLLTTYPIRIDQIDAMDYVQISRNFSRGEGFTTKFIRPVSLRFFPYYEKHPEITVPPLYILYMSGVMKMLKEKTFVAGESDGKLIIFGSGVFFMLCIPLFFWLATRFLKGSMAHLALLFFVTNGIVLKSSISALPDLMLVSIFLFLMILVSYYDGENVFLPALVGAVLGLCYLTRYSFGLFSLILMVYFYIRAKQYKLLHVVMFLVPFVAVISPWLLRNYRLTGNPFFTLEFFKYKMFTDILPGNLYWRTVLQRLYDIGFDPVIVARKLGIGLRLNYEQLLAITGNLMGSFFLVGLFCGGIKSRFERFKWLLVICFVLQLFLSALFRPCANVLLPFFPLIILVAVALFNEIMTRKSVDPFIRLAIVILFVMINIFPMFWNFVPKLFKEQSHRDQKQYWEENIIEVSGIANEGTVLISDIPWATAWYGNLISVWLPWSEEDYDVMTEIAAPVDGCYFSPLTLRYPQGEDKIWLKLYSFIVRYNQTPEDNRFGWTWTQRFRQGDAVCLNPAKLRSKQ
ncbi:MAG: hypothetical protein RBU23_07165 [Candidatus Auribacterota bacterium]|jgi:4-amino-4-deoxy-L-arabinose transferase-like glycosyltransferase|nr:hypothetical protein [Candidatus Auribacterota bacterium]